MAYFPSDSSLLYVVPVKTHCIDEHHGKLRGKTVMLVRDPYDTVSEFD